MRKLIIKLTNVIAQENQYNSDQKEQINFMLSVLVFELLKFIGIVALFTLAGYGWQCALILLCTGSLKIWIGGLHMDNQVSCFFMTFIITAIILFVSLDMKVDSVGLIIINIASLCAIYIKVPVQNSKMPITKQEVIDKNRKNAFIVLGVWFISFVIFREYDIFVKMGTISILSQAMLLFELPEKINIDKLNIKKEK